MAHRGSCQVTWGTCRQRASGGTYRGRGTERFLGCLRIHKACPEHDCHDACQCSIQRPCSHGPGSRALLAQRSIMTPQACQGIQRASSGWQHLSNIAYRHSRTESLLMCTLTHRAEKPGPLLPGLRLRLLLSSRLESDVAKPPIAVLPVADLSVAEVPRVEVPRLEVPVTDFPRPVVPVCKLASPVVVLRVEPARSEFLVPAYLVPSARTHHCHE